MPLKRTRKARLGIYRTQIPDLSVGTGELCILGHLGLVFIWSCFVSCLLFLLFYVSLRNLCSGTCRKIPNSVVNSTMRRITSVSRYHRISQDITTIDGASDWLINCEFGFGCCIKTFTRYTYSLAYQKQTNNSWKFTVIEITNNY